MRVIGLIPARSGSHGLPAKNFRPFLDGQSLLARTAHTAVASGALDDIVVSTDAPAIARASFGADYLPTILDRPPELATDSTPIQPVAQHAAEALGLEAEDWIILLYPIYPLRSPLHIRSFVADYVRHAPSRASYIGQVPVRHHPQLFRWSDGTRAIPLVEGQPEPHRRQDYRLAFRWTHFYCGFSVESLPRLGPELWLDGLTYPVAAPEDTVLDIDTAEDWQAALAVLRANEEQSA